MVIKDVTISFADILPEHGYFVHTMGYSGAGYYQSAHKVVGTIKSKRWFSKIVDEYPDEVMILEIINWTEVRIRWDYWDDAIEGIKKAAESFEKDTGQQITIKKINEFVQWGSY